MESEKIDSSTRLDKAGRGYAIPNADDGENLDNFDFSAPTKEEQKKSSNDE